MGKKVRRLCQFIVCGFAVDKKVKILSFTHPQVVPNNNIG